MCSTIILGIKLDGEPFQRVTVTNIDVTGEVWFLRQRISQIIGRPAVELELMYYGTPLRDECSLEYYGIGNGKTVLVFLRNSDTSMSNTLPEEEFQNFLQEFNKSGNICVLKQLLQANYLDHLIAKVPMLLKYPAALKFLQDPELLALFGRQHELRNILATHPILINALNPLLEAVKQLQKKDVATNTEESGDQFQDSSDDSSDWKIDSEEYKGKEEGKEVPPPEPFDVKELLDSTSTVEDIKEPKNGEIVKSEESCIRCTITEEVPVPYLSEDERLENLRVEWMTQLLIMQDMGFTNFQENIRALDLTNGNVEDAIDYVLMEVHIDI